MEAVSNKADQELSSGMLNVLLRSASLQWYTTSPDWRLKRRMERDWADLSSSLLAQPEWRRLMSSVKGTESSVSPVRAQWTLTRVRRACGA